MKHRYVACYFYDQEENPIRKKLKDEFVERYPWVTLLESRGKPGFVDYQLINQYLQTVDKDSLESLSIIDADVILEDNFRALIEKAIEENYDVIHGCNESWEALDGKVLSFSKVPSMTRDAQGHTGYCWTFSKRFLEVIGYTFPTGFVLGGFDYLLALIFIKEYPKSMLEQILGPVYKDLLSEFFGLSRQKILKSTTLEHKIIHNFHGSKLNRQTDFSKYQDLSKDPSLTADLMNARDSYF